MTALEQQILAPTADAVILTLARGRQLRTTVSALRDMFRKAAALACPGGDFQIEGGSHVLTNSEIDSVPSLRDVLTAEPPHPAVIASIKILATGPIGWHTDNRGRPCLNTPNAHGPLIRVVFVSPGDDDVNGCSTPAAFD